MTDEVEVTPDLDSAIERLAFALRFDAPAGKDWSHALSLEEAHAIYTRLASEARSSSSGEVERLREALTPYGETKHAYMGEFSWTDWVTDEDGIEQGHERVVPWTTIKEIMAAIRARAGVTALERGGRACCHRRP